MSNTSAVEEVVIENVQLNLPCDDGDDTGKTAVVFLLDQTFSSPQLKSTLENQTKLHMDWYNKMVSFYIHKAIIIPLEYCVSPSRADLPTESVKYIQSSSHLYQRVFLFLQGDDLRSAMSIIKNFVNLTQEEVKKIVFVDEIIRKPSSKLDEVFSAVKKRKIVHKDIEELDSSDVTPLLHLRNDRDYMMKQVQQNGLYLYYAHPDLLQDEELLLTAIKNNHVSMKYVPPTLRSRDENFVRRALELNGGVFGFLKQEWRSRQDFFELSLKTSGEGFSKVTDDSLITFDSAQIAISHNWRVIKQVEPDKPYYTKLVEIVLKQNVPDDELIKSNLISDTELIIKMLDISYKAFIVATKAYTFDEEIIVKALNKNLLLANYMTADHFKLILDHVDLINKLIQHPDNDMKSLVLCIGGDNKKQPHIDNIRSLIIKYPTLVNYSYDSKKCRLDPFILRYFEIETQLKILCSLNSSEKPFLEGLGYGLSTSSDDHTLDKLKERFSKSHPGLVIPYHRFGYSPAQTC